MAVRYRVDYQQARETANGLDVAVWLILGIHAIAAIGMGILVALTLATG